MARTTLLKTTVVGPYPTLQPAADSLDLNLQVATGSSGNSGNQFLWGDANKLLVIAQNSHASTGYTITITSKVDQFNRVGDITSYALAAGDVVAFLVDRPGWLQADGMLYCEGNNAAIKFAAIPIY